MIVALGDTTIHLAMRIRRNPVGGTIPTTHRGSAVRNADKLDPCQSLLAYHRDPSGGYRR